MVSEHRSKLCIYTALYEIICRRIRTWEFISLFQIGEKIPGFYQTNERCFCLYEAFVGVSHYASIVHCHFF